MILEDFPGLDKFTNVPNVNVPNYLQAEMPLSPSDLYKKFKDTDVFRLFRFMV